MSTAEQGTEAWKQSRFGFVTGSRFADVMTNARSKSGLSQTAERYMLDLIGEHLTQKPASTVKTFAMEWGTRWEPVAREEYEKQTGRAVKLSGFVEHGQQPFIGGSPDGFVGRNLIEIKAPLTQANHARVIISGTMPDEYFEQVQGYIWLTAAEWCDFVSYHPDFPDKWRLLIVRVERNDEYISELSRRVIAFRDEMVSRLNRIIERWE